MVGRCPNYRSHLRSGLKGRPTDVEIVRHCYKVHLATLGMGARVRSRTRSRTRFAVDVSLIDCIASDHIGRCNHLDLPFRHVSSAV